MNRTRLELAIAVLTGLVGLLGDALHNLSDVSTSLVVFLGFRISRRTPRIGHQVIEAVHEAVAEARAVTVTSRALLDPA